MSLKNQKIYVICNIRVSTNEFDNESGMLSTVGAADGTCRRKVLVTLNGTKIVPKLSNMFA